MIFLQKNASWILIMYFLGLVNERLINLEEERIKVEKQKLLEKKRCNNIRLKIEKERLEIERHRNFLLEKYVLAIQTNYSFTN